MADLQRLNHRHEQIINWLITHPSEPLSECAREFGYTQAWLSQVIHSDMFQAAYQDRCREAGITAIHTITSRLNVAAALALDKTIERLEGDVASERMISDTLRQTLPALGYGVKKDSPEGHLHLHLTAEDLTRAREAVLARKNGTTQAKTTVIDTIPQGDGNGDKS